MGGNNRSTHEGVVRNKRVNIYKHAWIKGTVLPELNILIMIIAAFQEK